MANRDKEQRVFDWDEAARIIKQRDPDAAWAGLKEDWGDTYDLIWEDGKIVRDSYTYLASTWDTPVLKIDGEFIPCWKMKSETPEWDAHTKWPDSATMIIHSKTWGLTK